MGGMGKWGYCNMADRKCSNGEVDTTTATPNTISSPVNEVLPGYEGCYKGLDSAKQKFDLSSGIGGGRNSPLM